MSFIFTNPNTSKALFDCMLLHYYPLKLLSDALRFQITFKQTTQFPFIRFRFIAFISFHFTVYLPQKWFSRFTFHVALFQVFCMSSFWFNIEKLLFCNCLFHQQCQYIQICGHKLWGSKRLGSKNCQRRRISFLFFCFAKKEKTPQHNWNSITEATREERNVKGFSNWIRQQKNEIDRKEGKPSECWAGRNLSLNKIQWISKQNHLTN